MVANYLKNHPEVSFKELAFTLNCSLSTIATIARQHGVVRQRKALTIADTAKLEGVAHDSKVTPDELRAKIANPSEIRLKKDDPIQ
jgi:hypothetical protein